MSRERPDLLDELSLSDIEVTRARDPESFAAVPVQPSLPRPPAPGAGRALPSSPTAAQTPQARAPETFPPPPPEAPNPVTSAAQVGRYELLLELASGGMATVYVGRQRGAGGFQRLVAIKRMHPHIGAEPELAASFMDEARIASLIRHPNVVNVHDVHESDGEHLLVMDYVEGSSLAHVMRAARKRNERISRPAALRILIDALHGLHAAHEQTTLDGRPLGVVHRDATPHNILLGTDGSVRITDFGIAKAAERSVNTATGLAKGKFRYMAPEQARGGALDRRVDVFAMGVVAWELLTGDRLFDGESDAEVLLAVTGGRYRRPTSVDATIPAELEAIVMKALAPEANERWPTALAFADALAAHGKAAGEVASPTEVARLVHEFCGDDVNKRRKTIGDVLQGRRAPAALSGVAHARRAGGTGSSTAGASAPLTLDSVKVVPALTPEELARYHARRRLLWGLAAAAGLAVAGAAVTAAVVFSRPRTEPAPAAVVTRVVSAVPPSAPAPLPSTVRVEVSADQDIMGVRGPGIVETQFKDKGAVLQITRADESVTLVVELADGTTIEESLVPKQNTAIRVRSVAQKSTTTPKQTAVPGVARPTGATTGATKPTGPAPGLEKNPYE